ncbi:MAG: hypothetical protein SFW63_01560 [Alphaproteobacteria bacterium]|nr:hypothetical protein [Alphaproteobacteria bacterium]
MFTLQQPRLALEKLSLVMVAPEAIKTDAQAYQFRAHGDSKGITEAHRIRRKSWNPILDGDPLLLHERLNGALYVADGHHRLDHAVNTNAIGTGPGKVAAYVLREADGYSVEDVRVIAAYKNMARGHTDALDAARVFKEVAGGRVDVNKLPPLQIDKGNLRVAYSMSKLPETVLEQVEREQVPSEMAASIAENFNTPELQRSMVEMVGKTLRGGSFVQRLAQSRQGAAGLSLN